MTLKAAVQLSQGGQLIYREVAALSQSGIEQGSQSEPAREPMPDEPPLAPETLARLAEGLVEARIDDGQLEAVAGLLHGLAGELGPMRAMRVDEAEPATTYDAVGR